VITFRPHTRWVTALAFTPDGQSLASVSHDGYAKVWEVTGLACQTLRWEVQDKTAINHCQFSPDGRELFTGGLDGCIRKWSTANGTLLRDHDPTTEIAPATAVYAFVLSRDGSRVAWCGRTGGLLPSHIVVARTDTLEVLHRIPAHDGDGRILAAYPDGFCSGAADRTVKFWDWNSMHCHRTIRLRGMSRALAVSRDGNRLAAAGVMTISVYPFSGHGVTGAPVHFRGHRKRIECIEFSSDGARLASASSDGTLRIWDAASGECLRIFALKLGELHWVTFSPDGLTLAYSSLKGDIGLLDLDD
jgi:WD40 repeat protein